MEKHRVRWADVFEDSEVECVVAIEGREQRKMAQCSELEMAEEREWEGKAAQDGELAAMEDRRRERQMEKIQGGVDEWDEVWVPGVCFGCGEEVFLGCKFENGPTRVGLTHEEVASGEKEDGIERQEDNDGRRDREGWQRERRIDVRRLNDWQGFEAGHEENGGRREDGHVWCGNRQGEEDPGAQGEGRGVCTRLRRTNWEDWVRRDEKAVQ